MYMFFTLQGGQGLTFGEILSDIPHDAGAILIYLLLAGSAYLIWRGSRQRS